MYTVLAEITIVIGHCKGALSEISEVLSLSHALGSHLLPQVCVYIVSEGVKAS